MTSKELVLHTMVTVMASMVENTSRKYISVRNKTYQVR